MVEKFDYTKAQRIASMTLNASRRAIATTAKKSKSQYSYYKRVLGIVDGLYIVGKVLKKKTPKAIVLAAGIGSTAVAGLDVYLKKHGYNFDIPNYIAPMIPVVVGIGMFGTGSLCTMVANMRGAKKRMSTHANLGDLMEKRREADLRNHLKLIWNQAGKYHSILLNTPEEVQREIRLRDNSRTDLENDIKKWSNRTLKRHHINKNDNNSLDAFIRDIETIRPFSSSMEATEEGFIESGVYAIESTKPEKVIRKEVGFNILALKRWLDGADFDLNDTKIMESYATGNALLAIRKKIGIPRVIKVKEALFGHKASLLFRCTMNKMATLVGSYIEYFNTKVESHKPNYFDAQDFLHDDPELDDMVDAEFGEEIGSEFRQTKRNLPRIVFGDDKETAHQHIYEMFKRDYLRLFELRLKYDIEFAAGLLDTKPCEEITEMEKTTFSDVYPNEKLNASVKKAERNLKDVDEFMQREMHNIMPDNKTWEIFLRHIDGEDYDIESNGNAGDNLPTLFYMDEGKPAYVKMGDKTFELKQRNIRGLKTRAARIGYHLNRFNIQKSAKKGSKDAIDALRLVTNAHERYSERVNVLRQEYVIAKLQIMYYTERVDKLAKFDEDKKVQV